MNDTQPPVPGDKRALETLEEKLQVLRDYVTAVAKSFKTGLFLHGT